MHRSLAILRPPRRFFSFSRLALLASLPIGAIGFAQVAPKPAPVAEEPIVELSPFTVNAEQDSGYQATSTLAGTRLRTNLSDVAASISVVTKEFLNDIGANGLDTLLNYTVGTEVNGLRGNMSGAPVDGQGFTDFDNNTGLREILPHPRIRGLDIADQTRDYFLTSAPTDTYNTERYDISRGANAILFGLGSPAGIVNASLIRANLTQTKGKYELELDNWGSVRHVLDFSAPIVKNKLAIRIAGLAGATQFKQDPAFIHDKRLTATLTAKPWQGATLRVTTENASQTSNKPQNRPPFDYVTWWWKVGRPVANAATGVVTMTATPANAYAAAVSNGSENGAIVTRWNYGNGINVIVADPNSSNLGMTFTPGGAAQGTFTSPKLNYDQTMRRLGAGWPTYSSSVFARLNQSNADSSLDPRFNFWKDPVLTDPGVFDFFNNMIEGPNKREWGFWNTLNATFEQQFNRDSGLEIAYDKQSLHNGYVNPWNWRDGYSLFVDINSVLPNGQVNPNFGRPYINNNSWQSSTSDAREAFRATAYYDLDLTKKVDGLVGRILGRHILTGAYTNQKQRIESFSGRPYVAGLDYVQAMAAAGYTPNWQTFDLSGGSDYRMVARTAYLGNSLANASSAAGAGIQGLKANVSLDGMANVSTLWYDNATSSWTTRKFSLIQSDQYDKRGTTTYGIGSLDASTIKSTAFVLNSYWFDKVLVSTLGWRQDKFAFSHGGVQSDPTTGLALTNERYITAAPTLNGSEHTFSYGIVGHLPQSLASKLPYHSNISLAYNKSDNFQPMGQRFDIYNRPISSPTGETKDYSLLITAFDGKVDFRITRYESAIANSGTQSGALRELINTVSRFPNLMLANMANPAYLTTPGNGATAAGVAAWDTWMRSPEATTLASTFRYQFGTTNGRQIITSSDSRINEVTGVSDNVAKGYEYELALNPTSHWRIAANASEQKVVLDHIAPELVTFIGNVNKALTTGAVASIPTSVNGGQTMAQWANQLQANFNHVLLKTGQTNSEVRRWRYNIVSNYDWNEGMLKGWNVGGAIRWQDKVAIGYDIMTVNNPDGTRSYQENINKPYYGPAETNYDAWVGYSRPILNRKINWKLQLNVRNLGVQNKLIPVVAQPDGSIATYRIAEPMTFTLTSRFEF